MGAEAYIDVEERLYDTEYPVRHRTLCPQHHTEDSKDGGYGRDDNVERYLALHGESYHRQREDGEEKEYLEFVKAYYRLLQYGEIFVHGLSVSFLIVVLIPDFLFCGVVMTRCGSAVGCFSVQS